MSYYLRIAGVNFPAAPESLEEEPKNKDEIIELITQQEVTIQKKPGLASYTMDLRLPREEWPWAYYEQPSGSPIPAGFNEPETYVEFLKGLKEDKEHFQIMLVEDMGEDGTVENFTQEVTLEAVSFTEEAGEGDDIVADCTFREWVEFSTKIKGKKSSKTSKTTLKPKKKTYTVKKGDTLKKISKKMYGAQKYAPKIYKWNKKKIEKAARNHGRKSSKNGKFIYKGTKLTLKKIKVKK